MDSVDSWKGKISNNLISILFFLIVLSLVSAYGTSRITDYSFNTLASVAGVFSSGILTLALARLYSLQNSIAKRQLELESQPFLQIRLLDITKNTLQLEVRNKGRDVARDLRIQVDVATDNGNLLQNQNLKSDNLRTGHIRPTASPIERTDRQEEVAIEYINEMIETGETSVFTGKTHLIMKEREEVAPDGRTEEVDVRFLPWITELHNEYEIDTIHFRMSLVYTDALDNSHIEKIVSGRCNLDGVENVEELLEKSYTSDKISEEDVVITPAWDS